jgi:hypothetical protein
MVGRWSVGSCTAAGLHEFRAKMGGGDDMDVTLVAYVTPIRCCLGDPSTAGFRV